MRLLRCKGLCIGEGIPKIVVPVMGAAVEQSIAAATDAIAAGEDIIEWRADFSANNPDAASLVADAAELAAACKTTPLLFTLRTVEEGGRSHVSNEEYCALMRALIGSGSIDVIDIEQRLGEHVVRDLVSAAHTQGVAAIVSSHDFQGAPSQEAMMKTLATMHEWGADIAKLAVTAHTMADSLRVMAATAELHRAHPDYLMATMAMGSAGSITRLMGECCGSALAFCSHNEESAPGQVEVTRARRIMNAVHDSIERDQ